MQLNTINSCEQCRRQVEEERIVKVEYDQHVGYVCPMCHYVLTKPYNQERFKSMIRHKTYDQSNMEMKEVHRLLSMLLTIGVAFCVIIIGAMFFQMTNAIHSVDILISTVIERFSNLNFIQSIKSS